MYYIYIQEKYVIAYYSTNVLKEVHTPYFSPEQQFLDINKFQQRYHVSVLFLKQIGGNLFVIARISSSYLPCRDYAQTSIPVPNKVCWTLG